MTKLNEKLYETLAPLERTKLAIAALTRNDEDEVARLLRSCPRYTYIGIDVNYKNQIHCMTWIKIHFNWICESYYSKIELLQSIFTFAESLLENLSVSKEEYQEKIKLFLIDWYRHTSSIKALYQGFSEFCIEVQLNKDQMLDWFEIKIMYPQIENYLENEKIIHDSELAEKYKNQFMKLWKA